MHGGPLSHACACVDHIPSCTGGVHKDMSVCVKDLFFMGASILPEPVCISEDVYVERL